MSPYFVQRLKDWLLLNLPVEFETQRDEIEASAVHANDALPVIPGGVFRKGRPPANNSTSNTAVRKDGASSLLVTSVRGVDHVLLPIQDLRQLAKLLPQASDLVLVSRVRSLLRSFGDEGDASTEILTSTACLSVETPSKGCEDSPVDPGLPEGDERTEPATGTAAAPSQSVDDAVTDTLRVRRGGVFTPYTASLEYKDGRQLRSYQVEGLNWLLSRWHAYTNVILADEMGLGKTAQTLSFLDHLHRVHAIRGPFLVVVPLSTIQHWEREISVWTSLPACVYHDSAASRAIIREWEWFYPGLKKAATKFGVRNL
jgi:SNF2-related domain